MDLPHPGRPYRTYLIMVTMVEEAELDVQPVCRFSKIRVLEAVDYLDSGVSHHDGHILR